MNLHLRHASKNSVVVSESALLPLLFESGWNCKVCDVLFLDGWNCKVVWIELVSEVRL